MAENHDLEPEKIEQENRTAVDKLRDLVNGLKSVEEFERSIPPNPDKPGK